MYKHAFLVVLSLFTITNLQAQLFGGEKVYVFGIRYRAKEVTGQKRFEANSYLYKTSILNPLHAKVRNEVYYSIGSYRLNQNTYQALDLFNLSFQRNDYPLLDLIDFDYYRSVGLPNLERQDPSILDDVNYLKIKHYLQDSTHLTVKSRKAILFTFPVALTDKIILTRYEVITNHFNIDKTKMTKTTAELRAQLDTINLNLSTAVAAKVRAYLSHLADQATVMQGDYLDIRLHPSYVAKIDYYINKSLRVDAGNDQFAANLKSYIASDEAAFNDELVAIQLKGSFKKTTISIDSIAADLSAKFQLSGDAIKKISAAVNFTFTRNEKIIFSNEFNNAWVIRYFTSELMDKLNFKKIGYVDGQTDGRNMGRLNRFLEEYYTKNGSFPPSLKNIGIDDLIDAIGESRLDYRYSSPQKIRLTFAAADYELFTNDDRIYEGSDGKISAITTR
ncbi:hypothetical protein [Chryseolinea lacunae]|uniref:Uncharacterized protein n=1 Tax=Chryseolinea lacunae TaxID=2801331 RepID=A0ABS1KS65_9BACT|nr:hypothetical protein [Chryseolinea lacunae]MBL0742097.1 hypothetical protein [Chryseolinea lacunae]